MTTAPLRRPATRTRMSAAHLASRHLPDSRTTARMPAHLTALAAVATALAVAMLVTGTLTTSWWWMPPFLMASTAAMAAATADKW